MNILAGFDEPSSGDIYFNKISLKKLDINKYHNEDIGFVFQQYHLIDEESVLYNITLPLEIKGERYKKQDLINYLDKVNLDESILNKKCFELSGGEKQRVAIIRAIINNPKIIFCDEPTGALDVKNSRKILKILKQLSKEKLVILVSHNLNLVEQYSDSILFMEEGKIVNERTINKIEDIPLSSIKTIKRKSKFAFKEGMNTVKRNKKNNIVSSLSLSFALIFSILGVGFILGSKDSIKNASLNQLDINTLTISFEQKINTIGSNITLTKQRSPTYEEINELTNRYSDFVFKENLSYFFPSNMPIHLNDALLDKMAVSFIEDYERCDLSLIKIGRMPQNDNEYLINYSAYEYLSKEITDIFSIDFTFKEIKEVTCLTGDDSTPYVSDYFTFNQDFRIVGVTKDFNFLSQPMIYLSYSYCLDVLKDTTFENYSEYDGTTWSYYDYLVSAPITDDIRSYSFMSFYHGDINVLYDYIDNSNDSFVFSSSAKRRYDACVEFINVASMGIEIFAIISFIGSFIIVSINSLESYVKSQKRYAIYKAVGADKHTILNLSLTDSIVYISLTFFLSICLSIIFEYLINQILSILTGVSNVICIPFISLFGHPMIFELILLIALLVTGLISTLVPFVVGGKISVKEVLKDK